MTTTTIEELMKEYSKWMSQSEKLEAQYKEALQNAESIMRVIKLIKKDSISSPTLEEIKPVFLATNEKYANMNMTAAIFDILKNEKNLTTDEIYQRLIENGFKSKSKTLKRDVATRLSGLKRSENIGGLKEGNLYRHYIISEKPTRSRRAIT